MRILHIDTGREMRGGQWQALLLMRELKQRGVAGTLMAPPEGALFAAAASDGLPAVPPQIAGLARAGAFDLVHAHGARAHNLALLTRKPLVVSRRVAFEVKRSPWSRWKYSRAAHYLAVSNYVKAALRRGGVPEHRISVVYDGVPMPVGHGVSSLPGMAAGERALAVAIDSRDPGKGRALIEEAARLADLPVHFSNDLPRDLPHARLFVYITKMEGLGSAVLLAMAHGAPVVASGAGGLPEIVRGGETGLLTENSPARIAAAMRQIWDDTSLAKYLACNAWRMVDRGFTAASMAERTLQVYGKVLG